MAITSYQVDSVLSAYARKSKVSTSPLVSNEDGSDSQSRDVVFLPSEEDNKSEEFEKISYNLRDVLLKDGNI